jgi:hypothetical protein
VKVSLVARSFLCALALALVAQEARADGEKVFHFKNGRKATAEVLEETPTSYVVKTAGGRSVFAKDTIASVEDPPTAQGDTFLGGPQAAKPGEKPAPAAPPAANQGPAPLASETEIASARRALAAVPASNPDDPQADQSRARALAAVSEGCPLGTLVTILAETSTPTPHERFIALELVIAAGERARPLLARAIRAADGTKALPNELLVATQKVGPDSAGEIEDAVLAKLAELRARHADPAPLGPVLKVVGSPRALLALYDWLLAPEKPDASASLSDICQGIVGAQTATDSALRPLVRLLDVKQLPGYRKVAGALDILGKTRGEAEPTIAAILDALETEAAPKDATLLSERALALASGYRALASVSNEAARDRLLKSLRAATGPEARLLVLFGMKNLRPTAEWPTADYLDAIAASMAELDRSAAEREAYGRVLASLTGRSFGTDPAAWRTYVQSLRH